MGAITEIDVLWITAGLGCDGDTISLTAATRPEMTVLDVSGKTGAGMEEFLEFLQSRRAPPAREKSLLIPKLSRRPINVGEQTPDGCIAHK